jgi:hypothetical protein
MGLPQLPIRQTPPYVNADPTFSDVMATIRRLFWQQTNFSRAFLSQGFQKLPPKIRNRMLDQLSPRRLTVKNGRSQA